MAKEADGRGSCPLTRAIAGTTGTPRTRFVPLPPAGSLRASACRTAATRRHPRGAILTDPGSRSSCAGRASSPQSACLDSSGSLSSGRACPVRKRISSHRERGRRACTVKWARLAPAAPARDRVGDASFSHPSCSPGRSGLRLDRGPARLRRACIDDRRRAARATNVRGFKTPVLPGKRVIPGPESEFWHPQGRGRGRARGSLLGATPDPAPHARAAPTTR